MLSGCAAQAPAGVVRVQQTVEGVTIALDWQEKPRLNQPQTFLITLTDEQGQAISGADVYMDLDMPAMPMGTNQPIATPEGGGTYRVEGIYTMTGEWHVTVVATVETKEHRAMFTTNVLE
ncbi:MAG: FixH family protein [Chloroflexaceae bacterium]|nr:FixH family protein [Chloroflexaceae bacterium]